MVTTFSLRHSDGTSSRQHLLGDRLFFIGASPENDLILEGADISDCAAKIEMIQSNYYCEPVGKSMVLLNGKKVRKQSLFSEGDRLTIGSHLLILEKNSSKVAEDTRSSTEPFLLDNIHRLIAAIGKERSLPVLLDKLMTALIGMTGGTEVFIFLLDKDNKPSLFVSTCPDASEDLFSDTIIQNVIQQGKGILIPNTLADPQYKNIHSIADLKVRSVICTPVSVAGKITGVLYVGCRNVTVSFNQQDLDSLTLYATIAGMLINHVEYITQQQQSLSKLTSSEPVDGIVAHSQVMLDLLSTLEAVAESDITVLLQGETGTGKSKLAQRIHQKSKRSQQPFVVVNCSALRGELLESELFGHKKGSFTGAVSDHEGLFQAADGGTLFLDEIGELEMQLQAKLLRTLETGVIRPIGATQELHVDTRLICATNRSLAEMIEKNQFRTDLFYRINQFSIEVPPLRNRGEDTLFLAYYFLEKFKAQYPSKDIFDFHPDTSRFITTWQWPGNIRELSNAIHRAVVTSHSPLIRFEESLTSKRQSGNFEQMVREFQKDLLQKALDCTEGNKEEAARLLELPRSTFYRYLSQFGL
ncbi:MAG TPA: sigma 54-interacting transcriptional regulator [Chitinispirillaceae bacterium]|nr:sigma 54-interacting transcriptional regulator [Chitinispirillaceae bacterium]